MTATTTERLTDRTTAPVALKVTLPSLAATKYLKGTIAHMDSNGRASNAVGDDCVGIYCATLDALDGANDDYRLEIEAGVFGFDLDGTVPLPGTKMYSVDNQTVSSDDDTGSRGFAGILTEVSDGQAYVSMNPVWLGLYA